jgi:hypothetical protein
MTKIQISTRPNRLEIKSGPLVIMRLFLKCNVLVIEYWCLEFVCDLVLVI